MSRTSPVPRVFRVKTLSDAHEATVAHVLENGTVVTTEDGEETVETGMVTVTVTSPLDQPQASPRSRFKSGFLTEYRNAIVYGGKGSFDYDYHTRLFAWGCGFDGAGKPTEVDQVAYIVEKVRAHRTSRRGVAVTWNPLTDAKKKDVPCLQLIQVLARHNTLSLTAIFRSNDVLSAMGANMYGLVGLQEEIAQQVGASVGSYTHIALVPHVYHVRDASDIPPFCGEGITVHPSRAVCTACGRCMRVRWHGYHP